MALRGVGPESEGGSARFHERRVTGGGPEVKYGRRRGAGKFGCVDQTGLFSSARREISGKRRQRNEGANIRKRAEPAFIEPMQCKPVELPPMKSGPLKSNSMAIAASP